MVCFDRTDPLQRTKVLASPKRLRASVAERRFADPVKSGLVASLARPGGNITGLSFMPDALGPKGVELLHEILPKMTRMAALYQGNNPGAVIRTLLSWPCRQMVSARKSIRCTNSIASVVLKVKGVAAIVAIIRISCDGASQK